MFRSAIVAALSAALLAVTCPVSAQVSTQSNVATSCNTQTYPAGSTRPDVQDLGGNRCVNASGGPAPTPYSAPGTSSSSTVTTHLTFQQAIAASLTRKGCVIQNRSADTEYVFDGATVSATTAASQQLNPGQEFVCANYAGGVETNNIAITSANTDGAQYMVISQ